MHLKYPVEKNIYIMEICGTHTVEFLKTEVKFIFPEKLHLPSTYSSFPEEKAKGMDIKVVYSSFDVLKIAEENPGRS